MLCGWIAADYRARSAQAPEQRWKRYEQPQPGQRVQVDVNFITPVGGAGKKFYQFTAIDDCTRLRLL